MRGNGSLAAMACPSHGRTSWNHWDSVESATTTSAPTPHWVSLRSVLVAAGQHRIVKPWARRHACPSRPRLHVVVANPRKCASRHLYDTLQQAALSVPPEIIHTLFIATLQSLWLLRLTSPTAGRGLGRQDGTTWTGAGCCVCLMPSIRATGRILRDSASSVSSRAANGGAEKEG